ncbi:hypothetical protein [Crateriforma conspicua]|uniref:hypothetical protein n=1 Tax=Crateriforma conspicua TaxID=2527996 RepID=UPI00118C44C0|nr:hypothetical protein [Crateriforma conspicua]QDV66010.1 hypothetical protein Mal65_51830 [Crateriforma conspicua]
MTHTEHFSRRTLGTITIWMLGGLIVGGMAIGQDIRPDQIQFRRQAVRRMVFDSEQAIPLAGLSPSKAIDLDLMHPDNVPASERAVCRLESGHLIVKAGQSERSLTRRWIGSVNPFATYEVEIASIIGNGAVGIRLDDSGSTDFLEAELLFQNDRPNQVRWTTHIDGNDVQSHVWNLEDHQIKKASCVLRVQMAAVGANVFIETSGRSRLIGYIDFSEHLELRDKAVAFRYEFMATANLKDSSEIKIRRVTAAITPGTGQADIRAITDEQGRPLLDDGRLWFTVTIRGRALPHPAQGVFSLNPSVFDLRFEGLIVFDMGDGLLRNELASHLFRDSTTGQWRGWTTGFSAFGSKGRNESKSILAVHSDRDPRKGYSIMKARPVGIDGAHEDPHGVYDSRDGKWRLLLCENAGGYKAAMWESDHWDHGYQRIAGPVEVDSTGTQIQQFGDKRFALFGSADRTVYVRSYPDLKPVGELQIHRPPWNDDHGTRIWPNVIPLPSGYPAPYVALMMDRANFPGMPKRNWTYGALYLYHGNLK